MSKEIDVNNCFDAAFLRRKGIHPQADKNMGSDYFCSEPDVLSILLSTQSCLSAKGYIFQFDRAFTEWCLTKRVIEVLIKINAATKPKSASPLLSAVLDASTSTGKRSARTKRKRNF